MPVLCDLSHPTLPLLSPQRVIPLIYLPFAALHWHIAILPKKMVMGQMESASHDRMPAPPHSCRWRIVHMLGHAMFYYVLMCRSQFIMSTP